MLPFIAKPPLSHRQKALAISVAGAADLLQIVFLPLLGIGYVLDDVIDLVTALILVFICGWKWQFVLAFLFELIPGLDLFPTWTAVILALPSSPSSMQTSPIAAADLITATRVPQIQPREFNPITPPPIALPPSQTSPTP